MIPTNVILKMIVDLRIKQMEQTAKLPDPFFTKLNK